MARWKRCLPATRQPWVKSLYSIRKLSHILSWGMNISDVGDISRLSVSLGSLQRQSQSRSGQSGSTKAELLATMKEAIQDMFLTTA